MEINRGLEIKRPLHVTELNLSLFLMFFMLEEKKRLHGFKNIFRICLPEHRKSLK